MPLLALPAVFMRGGTSRAVMFHARDLPERVAWDPIFLAAMGSPDPNGRQLNGMGGGISSLSKVCILAPSERADADIDYTFAQVQIREAAVDYRGNCGNMSSAVGPFAVDEGLLRPNGDTAVVRIFNTNTKKIICATFPLVAARAAVDGELAIPGVAGTGAPVRLDFLSPGGAGTGRLLPTGNVVDRLDVPGVGPIDVSMVDAANPCVFVRARDIGLTGGELPDALDTNTVVLDRLQRIRRAAAVAMGIARDEVEARLSSAIPAIGFVAPAMDAPTLSGEMIKAGQVDLTARFISNGQPHRALPLTASLCTAVAARIDGTLPSQALGREPEGAVRIGMPSGILTVDADVVRDPAGAWVARSGAFYRTARRLFDGRIYVPQSEPAT
ncbi:MAG: PrpF domain-containing protein [Rhodopila sp.]|nr:PrpF domain-containing protein [Rhodopila sp.]